MPVQTGCLYPSHPISLAICGGGRGCERSPCRGLLFPCRCCAARPCPGYPPTPLRGKIDGVKLGRTLTHEHLTMEYGKMYLPPPAKLVEFLEGDINLKKIGFVQRYPYSNMSNLTLGTEEAKKAVLNDVEIFKSFGGGAIVENSCHGLARNVDFLEEVSKKTGVHVVAGTGYYLASVHTGGVLNKSIEEIYSDMKSEMVDGCRENSKIKCGFMGEIASDYPMHGFEKRVIQATGELQQELKCPASFHPGRDAKAPHEIMRIYSEAGGDTKKAVMSHLDRTFRNVEQFLQFAAEYNCYLQQDLFGTEVLTYQFDPEFPMPSDAQRIEMVKMLIGNGHRDRILLSHDVHTKHRLIEFGGHGYSHIFTNVADKMLKKGITRELIDQITMENPKNWISWNCL